MNVQHSQIQRTEVWNMDNVAAGVARVIAARLVDERAFDCLLLAIVAGKGFRGAAEALLEIVEQAGDGFRMIIVLPPDVGVLLGDLVNEGGIAGVGRVVVGTGAEEVQVKVAVIEVEDHGMACDAQIFKARAEQGDARSVFVPFQRVLGAELGDDAVGCDDVQNIQIFDDCRRQGIESSAVLDLLVAGNLRIAAGVRDDALQFVIVGVLRDVAAIFGQAGERLRVDVLPEGKMQMTAQDGSFRMVVVLRTLGRIVIHRILLDTCSVSEGRTCRKARACRIACQSGRCLIEPSRSLAGSTS